METACASFTRSRGLNPRAGPGRRACRVRVCAGNGLALSALRCSPDAHRHGRKALLGRPAWPALTRVDLDIAPEGGRYSRFVEHVLSPEDARLVDGLRRRDDAAFAELMRDYGAAMLRVARMYVSSRAVAEDVVQEAWLAVLNGIDRFEGRSSLKTWIFRILANTAKTRGVREARSVPFSSLADGETESAVEV